MKKILAIAIIAVLLSIILINCTLIRDIHHLIKCDDPTCRSCMELQMIQRISEIFNSFVIKYYLIYFFLATLYKIIQKIIEMKKDCLVELNIRMNE